MNACVLRLAWGPASPSATSEACEKAMPALSGSCHYGQATCFGETDDRGASGKPSLPAARSGGVIYPHTQHDTLVLGTEGRHLSGAISHPPEELPLAHLSVKNYLFFQLNISFTVIL